MFFSSGSLPTTTSNTDFADSGKAGGVQNGESHFWNGWNVLAVAAPGRLCQPSWVRRSLACLFFFEWMLHFRFLFFCW